MRTTTIAFVFAAVLSACAGGGGDDPAPTPDAPQGAFCGDGTCAGPEVGNCPQDCGNTSTAVCGNLTCDAGETPANCPNDCQGGPVCGDGTCDAATENATNCPGDCSGSSGGTCPADPTECLFCVLLGDPSVCPPGLDPNSCSACIGGGGGGFSFCDGGAPDGTCNPATEDADLCPEDCAP